MFVVDLTNDKGGGEIKDGRVVGGYAAALHCPATKDFC
jgi:hypothetical protein